MPEPLRCPHCKLVNFAGAELCKRCKSSLLAAENTLPPDSDQVTERKADEASPNLFPCPDCGHLCSNLAKMCPSCGRVLRAPTNPSRKLIGAIAALCCFALITVYLVYSYSAVKREVDVKTAVQAGDPMKAGVSAKNAQSAKAALNAVGEVESVVGIGTSYQQYTLALQGAKIKYDAAMREFEPQDSSDRTFQSQLEATFTCYVDAASAWGAFIQDGDEYGFLDSANYKVSPMESKYGFHSSDRRYFRSEVIQSIWKKATENFESARSAVNYKS